MTKIGFAEFFTLVLCYTVLTGLMNFLDRQIGRKTQGCLKLVRFVAQALGTSSITRISPGDHEELIGGASLVSWVQQETGFTCRR